jgi:hypothetical protein
MKHTLFVSCLPYGARERDVVGYVAPFAEVLSVQLNADWTDAIGEPHALVTIDAADCSKAVNALDGREVGGKSLRVHRYLDREDTRTFWEAV